jgi:hypothetical protein
MSTTATRPLFFESQLHLEAKTETGKDAGPKPYANTARHEDAARRRFAGSSLFAEQQPDSRTSLDHGSLTLGERISGVWEGLLRTGTADCPVCRGPMERAGQSGHCLRCGSILS